MRVQKGDPLREFKLTQFLEFLKKEGCSPVTCKNYAADIRHFLKFFETKRETEFSPQIFSEYKKFLTKTPLSVKSINRRLSTLRKFGHFLVSKGSLSKNPAAKIKNITPLAKKIIEIKTQKIPQFKKPALFLALTICSITLSLITLSVTRRPSPPLPPLPKPVLRTLTFQGQLTDSRGRPRTSLALATFRLWDQKVGGNQLYSSGLCFIKPDQNGLFSIVIGQDCGEKIPVSFFTKYEKIYLEMDVEGEKKLARTQILNTSPALFAFPKKPTPPPKKEDLFLEKTLKLLTSLKNGVPEEEKLFDSLTFRGGSRLFEKEGRLATEGDFEVNKIIDGGLGIFGTSGRELPSTFDFTKGLTLEFDFQTGKETFELTLSPQVGKSYYCSFNKNNEFSIGKIVGGIKDEFLKVEKGWQDEGWFHGWVNLQQSTLTFKVSGTTISAPLDTQSVPLTKTGTIRFDGDLKSIANLRIFTGEKTLLTSGEAEIEESLQVKGALKVNLSGATSTNDVCWQGNMDAAQLVACSQGADLAEYYEAAEDVEEGDVVSIQTTAPSPEPRAPSQFSVSKSSRPYDPNLIGVVSTLPWRIMGNPSSMGNPRPVALAGRVPVKVKGEIKVGDPLTSSEIPGVAKKAREEGLILGRALENCHPGEHLEGDQSFTPGVMLKGSQENTSEVARSAKREGTPRMVERLGSADCKILAFINISWFKPELPPASFLAKSTELKDTSEVARSAKREGTPRPVEKLEGEMEKLVSGTPPRWNWEENLTLPNDLTVLGKTSLGQTSIAGSLLVDGSLTLDRSGINNLFGPLKLQPYAKGSVDILAGLVVIDKQGNLKVQGKIFAQEIETQKLNIKETAGTATLPAGKTEFLITNTAITNHSLIFLTPLSSTGNQTLYVKLKNPGEYFVVGIDKPIAQDITFNWWIIN